MFEPGRASAEQQGLEELNQKLANLLGVRVNPGLPNEEALNALMAETAKLEQSDYTKRNNRMVAREFAAKLVINHCPKQALRLLLRSEAGAAESLDDEKDNSIKADALMRLVERWYPLKELVFSAQTQALLIMDNDQEDVASYANYINVRIDESLDSLRGTIVHGPQQMTIEDYFKKNVDPMIQRLETKLYASSNPASKK